MITVLKNCNLIQQDKSGLFDIILKDELIKEVLPAQNTAIEGAKVYDIKGKNTSAGFIDIHVHGGGGHDFMDGTAKAYEGVAAFHIKHGTTSLTPTTVASTKEELLKCCELFDACKNKFNNASRLTGLHLEGPYISPLQAGALDPNSIKGPDRQEYVDILSKTSGITRWTIAPEMNGALEMADFLAQRGILASVGHSNATLQEVEKAIQHGFLHVTHLYSAMSGVTRVDGFRYGGVIESAYLFEDLTSEIIADGCHLPKELLQLAYKFIGADRLALVTDAMRGAGSTQGESILGSLQNGQSVIIEDGVAKMPDRKAFAGSIATADRLVRTMIKTAQVPLVDAIKMITQTPAKIIGSYDKFGSIERGKYADIVIFDDDINIEKVFLTGNLAVNNNIRGEGN